MTKEEWISYFEAINGRQPTTVEMRHAFRIGEITRKSYWFRFRRMSIWKQISLVLFLFLIIAIAYKPALKMYYQSQESRYQKLYKEQIANYQDAILKQDGQRVSVKYFEQPTRNPSYLIEDLDDDGKVEMYIGFDDGEKAIKVLEQFDVSFGKLKTVAPITEVSSEKNWVPFDVEGLYQISLAELSNEDFSSVNDVWVTKDSQSEIRVYDDGIAYINGKSTKSLSSGTSSTIIGDKFGFLNLNNQGYEGYAVNEAKGGKISLTALTNLGVHYTYTFIPKGIEYKDTDSKLDRLVVDTFDGEDVLYRSSDIQTAIKENEQSQQSDINLTDLVRGDFSSLVGTWKNSSYSFTIDEKGNLQWQNSSQGTNLALRDLRIQEEKYIRGVIGDEDTTWQNAIQGAFITIIPAGVTLREEKDTDNTKTRIIVGTSEGVGYQGKIYYKVE